MDKDYLLETAKQLVQVDEKCAMEFSTKRDSLVSLMNAKMNSRKDIVDLVGENNLEMMKDNHANHARFLESLFINYSPEVLVDTVIWVFKAYKARNFESTYWAAQLNAWMEIYKEELSEETYNSVLPYYKWMQINIPIFNTLADSTIEQGYSKHN